MKLTPGQSKKEKEYLKHIQRKNAEKERLPRGKFIPK
jgi:hypothetical protein